MLCKIFDYGVKNKIYKNKKNSAEHNLKFINIKMIIKRAYCLVKLSTTETFYFPKIPIFEPITTQLQFHSIMKNNKTWEVDLEKLRI